MIKKILMVLSVGIMLQLLIISCCRDTFYKYFSIVDVQSINSLFQTELPDSAIVKEAEYRLKIHLSGAPYLRSYISSLFINQAMAFSCEEIFVGIDSKIEGFSISANQSIYNTNAGEPLDHSKFRVNSSGFESAERDLTIGEWLDTINNSGYIYNLTWYFRLNEPLLIDDFIKFKINIIQKDGTVFESQTSAVKLIP